MMLTVLIQYELESKALKYILYIHLHVYIYNTYIYVDKKKERKKSNILYYTYRHTYI